ncbi:MAG: hypothetical protein WA690_19170 [Candidatus Acidiferrales bacterium]
MTLLAIPSIVGGVAFVLALAWFLARPLPQELLAIHSEAPDGLLTEHAQHLPQLRHPLAGTDTPYVKRYASPQIATHWRDDRQQALRNFLLALGEDFAPPTTRRARKSHAAQGSDAPRKCSPPAAAGISCQLPSRFTAASHAQPRFHFPHHQDR